MYSQDAFKVGCAIAIKQTGAIFGTELLRWKCLIKV